MRRFTPEPPRQLSLRNALIQIVFQQHPRAPLRPERFQQHAVRAHRAIENTLHWVLDVTMNEDRQRNRKDNGPENLAMMRCLALNIARREPGKGSMRGKLKRAAWNDDFLINIIRSAA